MMLPLLLMTSCLKDQEDFFDQSASKRVTEYLSKAKKTLVDAEYGWVLNYYPDRNQSYGGYVYTLKFDEQNVEARCELAAPTKAIKSTYVLNNESGPVLLFDTYNDFLHYFTTPSGSSGAGGYEAYDGDHMFLILDISEDGNTIKLKGSRSGNIMYMHKLQKPAEDYLAEIVAAEEEMVYSSFVNSANEKITLKFDGANHWATFENEETGDYAEAAFIFNANGVDFYEPIEFEGAEITGLTYSNLTFTTVGENAMTFNAVIPNINETLVDGTDWYFGIANVCPTLQAMWQTAAANLLAAENETIGYMVLEGDTYYMQSGNYAMAFSVGSELIGEDTIKLQVTGYGGNSTQQGNASYYYALDGFKNFIAHLNGTYKLEYADSKMSSIKAVSTTNPDIWFICTKSSQTPY